MSWAKKFPLEEAPGTIFETLGGGQYPPQRASLERTLGWTESEYQSGLDRIVKSSRRWITSSPLEWITF